MIVGGLEALLGLGQIDTSRRFKDRIAALAADEEDVEAVADRGRVRGHRHGLARRDAEGRDGKKGAAVLGPQRLLIDPKDG
jgi:hypothetical protein